MLLRRSFADTAKIKITAIKSRDILIYYFGIKTVLVNCLMHNEVKYFIELKLKRCLLISINVKRSSCRCMTTSWLKVFFCERSKLILRL